MFKLILTIVRFFFLLISSKNRNIVIENAILKKENEILKRRKKQKLKFKFFDRLFYAVIFKLSTKAKEAVILVKPETVLKWHRNLIKRFWIFPSQKPKNGRPPVHSYIKDLILDMKNKNLHWGYKRIQGELLKLGIELDKKTIWNILHDFRKKGKVNSGLTWSEFLSSQIKSIYVMDFFTVDTIFNIRFFVFFIIKHETREIIQFGITLNPVKEYVRQQIINFSSGLDEIVYLIHDRTGEFWLEYRNFGIIGIKTSVKAPNMNSIAERFIGSVRREILDNFIIFSQQQLYKILNEYIVYYNSKRPHQGIEQRIPKGHKICDKGKVKSRPVLFGLNYEYYREAA
ncbi:transposase [candidate division KSB1 bacterium]|nr:transposase [candidate division KSB1 bacterium]